jgi:hypothetical protein
MIAFSLITYFNIFALENFSNMRTPYPEFIVFAKLTDIFGSLTHTWTERTLRSALRARARAN